MTMTDEAPGPVLCVQPDASLVDEPLTITVDGLRPSENVVISARAFDGALREWRGRARFAADEQGHLDLGRQAPVEGSYAQADPLGLLWSMQPVEPGAHAFFVRRKPRPVRVTVDLDRDGAIVASSQISRGFAGPGVCWRAAEDPVVVGTLFSPGGSSAAPPVILLGGSDGGQLDPAAALLASHGFTVLSLAYFGAEDRPANLVNIPLEYFGAALSWLAAQPEATSDGISLVGLSRGAELALQLGSVFPQVQAVVAVSPSDIRYAGIAGHSDYKQPAWIVDGEPLPYVAGGFTIRTALSYFAVWAFRRPVRQRGMFLRSRRASSAQGAAIAVEKINGPVMLIAGTDDQLWPSSLAAASIMRRLRAHTREFADECLGYPGAGHFLCFPYGLPSLPPMISLSPAPRIVIDFGGRPERNAAAAREAWPEILRFLTEAARPGQAEAGPAIGLADVT